MPSKPRLTKATWWTTPESGFWGSEVGEMSTRCTTGLPSLYIQAPGKAKFGRAPFSRPSTSS